MRRKANIGDLTSQIKDLLVQRNDYRDKGDFLQADRIKAEILAEGYELRDGETGVELWVEDGQAKAAQFIVLFGSGETAKVSVETHSYIFTGMRKDQIKIVLLTTPAGFQPNVNAVYQELADFFTDHLPNFHPEVKILEINDRNEANKDEVIAPINQADYIFTGPGSPTYAINQLKSTKALALIKQRLAAGASLGLASAATVAMSKYALPVYEIFKVGEPLHWQKGLDLYPKELEVEVVIPHFNNSEGGGNLDTSYCYMGKARFAKLRSLLPQGTRMMGIDEHTAVVFDRQQNQVKTFGRGQSRLQ